MSANGPLVCPRLALLRGGAARSTVDMTRPHTTDWSSEQVRSRGEIPSLRRMAPRDVATARRSVVPPTADRAARLRYRRRYLACEVAPADQARLVAAVEQLPAAMSGQFHNLDIRPIVNVRRRGLFRLRVGAYRVVFWPVDDEIVVLELDRRDDTTYEHLDRLVVHRRGAGVQVTEVPEAHPVEERPVAGRGPSRRSVEPVRENPLTVFTTPQLQ